MDVQPIVATVAQLLLGQQATDTAVQSLAATIQASPDLQRTAMDALSMFLGKR
jgi:hypothetical protein